MDSQNEPREAFRALMDAAVLTGHYGPNLQQRDLNIELRKHQLHEKAVATLAAIPEVNNNYGFDALSDLTLKFAHGFCSSLESQNYDSGEFEHFWNSFWEEINQSSWTYRGIAHLQNIEAFLKSFNVGNDITIQMWGSIGRESIPGWTDGHEQIFHQEWRQIMASHHVMIIKAEIPKSPANARTIDWEGLLKKSIRALRALRLLRPGDVRIGRIWLAQPAHFHLLGDGIQSAGISMLRPGRSYYLAATDAQQVTETFNILADFESGQEALSKKKRQKLGNIEVALRAFDAIYDRQFHRGDDQIVDAVTSLEAILRIGEAGLAFRTALRVAGLLARHDDERVKLFKDVLLYYDTRSTIVHGDFLEPKHESVIQNNEPLRDVVRQLLLGFLKLTKPGQFNLDENFWKEIDRAVLHTARREELRRRMGLTDLDETIRKRAYQRYEERRGTAGSPEDDWLKAEAEVLAAEAENKKSPSQRFFEMAKEDFLAAEPASKSTSDGESSQNTLE